MRPDAIPPRQTDRLIDCAFDRRRRQIELEAGHHERAGPDVLSVCMNGSLGDVRDGATV
jgi:hypothetical protein